jgi:hypothetical protein
MLIALKWCRDLLRLDIYSKAEFLHSIQALFFAHLPAAVVPSVPVKSNTTTTTSPLHYHFNFYKAETRPKLAMTTTMD